MSSGVSSTASFGTGNSRSSTEGETYTRTCAPTPKNAHEHLPGPPVALQGVLLLSPRRQVLRPLRPLGHQRLTVRREWHRGALHREHRPSRQAQAAGDQLHGVLVAQLLASETQERDIHSRVLRLPRQRYALQSQLLPGQGQPVRLVLRQLLRDYWRLTNNTYENDTWGSTTWDDYDFSA